MNFHRSSKACVGDKNTQLQVWRLLLQMILTVFITEVSWAQNGKSVVIGNMVDRPSAMLVINPPNGDQGVLIPQMTSSARLSMRPSSPNEDGLLVFDVTSKSFYFWRTNKWTEVVYDLGVSYNAGTNKLQVGSAIQIDLTNLKELPSINGNNGKYLTTDGISVFWTNTLPASDKQDLTLSGKILSLTNDATPVDLNAIVWSTNNIADASITNTKVANGVLAPAKFVPGPVNTTLTTSSLGVVSWTPTIVNTDAQDLSLAGNTLSLTNDASTVNLNAITTSGQVTGPINNLLIAPNSITTAQLQNNSISTSKLNTAGVADANKVFATDAAGNPQLQSKASLLTGVAASGDLSGSYPAPAVVKLQGNPLAPGALGAADAGKLMLWNGAQWTPQTVAGVSGTTSYVMIDPSEFTNLRRGDKKDKDNIIMFDDNSTYVTTIKKAEGSTLIAPVQLPHGAKIEQVSVYYLDRELANIVFDMYRKDPFGANQSVVSTWTSFGLLPLIQTATLLPIAGRDIVDNNSYSYRVVVDLDQSLDVTDSNDANLRIYAVKIRYSN